MLPSLRRAEMEWVALEASGLLVRSTSLKVTLPLSLRVPASEMSPVTSPAQKMDRNSVMGQMPSHSKKATQPSAPVEPSPSPMRTKLIR